MSTFNYIVTGYKSCYQHLSLAIEANAISAVLPSGSVTNSAGLPVGSNLTYGTASPNYHITNISFLVYRRSFYAGSQIHHCW